MCYLFCPFLKATFTQSFFFFAAEGEGQNESSLNEQHKVWFVWLILEMSNKNSRLKYKTNRKGYFSTGIMLRCALSTFK